MDFTHVTSDVLFERIAFATDLTRILLHFRVRQLVSAEFALREELSVALAHIRFALVTFHVRLEGLFRLVVVLADGASIRFT